MLYYIFQFLEKQFNLPGAGLFQYITFRAGSGIILALLISILVGNKIISSLKRMQIGETVRDLGLDGQKIKEGTPTMGGIIIIISVIIPTLLFAKLDNIYTIILIFSTLWMGAIGFVDDYIKVFKKNKQGLKAKFKILGQVILGAVIGIVMLYHPDVLVRVPKAVAESNGYNITKVVKTNVPNINEPMKVREMAYVKNYLTNMPFVSGNELNYEDFMEWMGFDPKWLFLLMIPLIIFIVTAVTNGSNLTDGLDGLASGSSSIIAVGLVILAYVSSNTIIADYLNIVYIPYSEETVVFAAIFLGATAGFLWFNSFPARVFMGDTGSLAIGGIIVALSILLRKELLIPILCGVFFIESLSVVLQVSYFKITKRFFGEGRRIFLMSPLHHHFQKQDIHEAKIVVRFWIIGIILTLLTIITLKIR
ncbi:MAG: phospho-N-acetylmuramoyl-pentapeptide-transferase [Saprospiraceae bacterium]|nr:phospho-N-acetylmuramoyl-pentapeptide-transferase [Saprospiraceae bacterium]